MCNLGNSLRDCRVRIHRNANYGIAIRTEIRHSAKHTIHLHEFDGTTVDFGYWFSTLWTISCHKNLPPHRSEMIPLLATKLAKDHIKHNSTPDFPKVEILLCMWEQVLGRLPLREISLIGVIFPRPGRLTVELQHRIPSIMIHSRKAINAFDSRFAYILFRSQENSPVEEPRRKTAGAELRN